MLRACGFESHCPHYVIFIQGGKSLESLVSSHSARIRNKNKHRIFSCKEKIQNLITHMFNWWLSNLRGLVIHPRKESCSNFGGFLDGR